MRQILRWDRGIVSFASSGVVVFKCQSFWWSRCPPAGFFGGVVCFALHLCVLLSCGFLFVWLRDPSNEPRFAIPSK